MAPDSAQVAAIRDLVARSDDALEQLDRYRHIGSPTLEREALRRLREEHEIIKGLLSDESDSDETPRKTA